MFLLTLLSLTLFVIPIFLTFGTYFAIEYQNILSCGFNCGQPGGSIGGLPGIPVDLTGQVFCQLSYAIVPTPGDYTLNPNQWGNTDGDEGSLCITITGNNVPARYSNSWEAEWRYLTPGPEQLPVHAFPNSALTDGLPVQMGDIKNLEIDVEWHYDAPGDLEANVNIDMFLSHSGSTIDATQDADFEVMVWLAKYGGADPLGYGDPVLDTRVLAGTNFELYRGKNQFGQLTFTWLPSGVVQDFDADILPLMQDLEQYNGPDMNDYLDYVAFGSEAFTATANATFVVPRQGIMINQ